VWIVSPVGRGMVLKGYPIASDELLGYCYTIDWIECIVVIDVEV
jgi:hypothetical protein